MAIFCLLFVVIGGVSASDVVDISNNQDNNNLLSDSIDSESEESVGNYYTNQLSNEAISSLNSQITEDNSFETTNGVSDVKSISTTNPSSILSVNSSSTGSNISTSKNTNSSTTKSTTSLKLSATKIYAGNSVSVTLKDKNGKVLSGKKVLFNVISKNKVYTKTTDSKGQAKLTFRTVGTYKIIVGFDGDTSFKSSKLNSTIKVLKSKTSLKISSNTIPKSTSLVVSLKNKVGNSYISGKKISFKISGNNKVYTKTTNSKGQARLVIGSKKTFSIVISFAGDKSFYKSKIKTNIKTIKCKTKLLYSSTKVKYWEDFLITLKKITNYHIKNKKLVINITNKNIIILFYI